MKLFRSGMILFLAGVCASAAAQGIADLRITEFMASNSTVLADGLGAHPDWVEIHNPGASEVSLAGAYLTDNENNLMKWQFPAVAQAVVPADGFLVVMASGNATGSTPYVDALGYIHTSWRLDAGGEDILLVGADGTTVISSHVNYPNQTTDVSFGVGSNGFTGFLGTPTPGAANSPAAEGWVSDTQFSVGRGFFSEPFMLEIATSTTEATIHYTLDGGTPTESNGSVYTGPISISTSTVVRAFAFREGWFPTNVDTQTYLFPATTIVQAAIKPSASWPDPFRPTGGPGGGGRQAIDYEMDPDVTGNPLYADLMDDALLSVPTISLVTDLPNLFDATTGIYVNAQGEGDEWERPTSVELIHPDGSEGFQVDAGLRIRGGVSAGANNPKHSFRIIMRSEYGNSKINYPIFGPDGPQSFDKLDFRTAQNFSWNLSSPANATWLDDPFSRDTMRDMGHPYTNGFFLHLYINGIYWGLFQTEERPDAFYGASYMGGTEEEYDVVKSDEDNGTMYAVDGTTDFYFNVWSLANMNLADNANYFALLGRNPDGTRNPTLARHVDEANLIDYMLIVFFTGAQDMPLGPPNSSRRPRNLYATMNRVNSDGIKWLPHDNEWSLVRQSGVNYNRVSFNLDAGLASQDFFNPWSLHNRLRTNSEYLMYFADRVQKHFFNGGTLTPEACTARYTARKDEIDLAIIAESARWGDYLSPATPRTRNVDWLNAVNWVIDNYFIASPQTRTEIVLGQLRTAGLFPSVDAPVFSQHGGTMDAGGSVGISSGAGTIHYTTDGSDPRMAGGAVNPISSAGTSGLGVVVTAPTRLKARLLNGSTWSALAEADFTVRGAAFPETWVLE
jgi:hypothetical protein